MDHERVGNLPKSKRWREIVDNFAPAAIAHDRRSKLDANTIKTLIASMAGNDYCLRSPEVTAENADAFVWLEAPVSSTSSWSTSLSRGTTPWESSTPRPSTGVWRRVSRRTGGGDPSEFPLVSRRSYWCIVEALRAVRLEATPCHTAVPCFGEWGFVAASRDPFRLPERLMYLNAAGRHGVAERSAHGLGQSAGEDPLGTPEVGHALAEHQAPAPRSPQSTVRAATGPPTRRRRRPGAVTDSWRSRPRDCRRRRRRPPFAVDAS